MAGSLDQIQAAIDCNLLPVLIKTLQRVSTHLTTIAGKDLD